MVVTWSVTDYYNRLQHWSMTVTYYRFWYNFFISSSGYQNAISLLAFEFNLFTAINCCLTKGIIRYNSFPEHRWQKSNTIVAIKEWKQNFVPVYSLSFSYQTDRRIFLITLFMESAFITMFPVPPKTGETCFDSQMHDITCY